MAKKWKDKMTDELNKAVRLDNRRTPGNRGRGADSDEATDGVADSGRDGKPKSTGYRHTSVGGYWRRSAYLACRAGLPMRSDDRGLPPGYAQGPTWLRAKREEYRVLGSKLRVADARES